MKVKKKYDLIQTEIQIFLYIISRKTLNFKTIQFYI